MNEIDGINDRKNLFLLLYKEKRSKSDDRKLNKLKERYPDYENYKYNKLVDDLYNKKFIKDVDLDPTSPVQSASGAKIIYDNFGNPRYKRTTTASGENALSTGFFKSETTEQSRNKRKSRLDSTFKWVAIIGGILGFFSFIRQFF